MNLIFGQDEAVATWVAAQIPHMPTSFREMAAIGVADDGMLLGAVVYHEFRGNDIQMSCAAISGRWLTRRFLNAMFSYPFIQLKCDRVTSFIPSKNEHTRRFCEGFGFKQEGIMRRGFLNDDCVMYGLLKEECKWIRENNNG